MGDLSRRRFVQGVATALSGLALSRDPYRPWRRVPPRRAAIRIRGRVLASGRGVAGAGLSDGLTVVSADAEGRFELVSDEGRRFLSLSPPRGYELPVSPTGTLRLFQPMAPDARGEMASLFQLVARREGDEDHGFLLLADPQTQDREETGRLHAETVPDVQGVVRSLGGMPLFGVGDGDIMYDELSLYPEWEAAVKAMGIPFAQVVGNHDLDLKQPTDDGSTTTFRRHFGPTHYSFNRGQVHYVVLDDVFYYDGGYLGYVTDEQLAWLKADLARVERGAPVVVFLHIPLYTRHAERQGLATPGIAGVVTNREAVYRLLEPFRALVLSGHLHESDFTFEGRTHERNHGAVCGAWWSGDICWDGTPNGYGVYQVRGADVRWRYKSTGKDFSHQLRLYAHGADPKAPDEIVANVWDWDSEWTVVWYEDGERKGAMSRRIGLDPLSVKLQTGPDLPRKRGWVEPQMTGHLFYAPASRGAREIRVEGTDRWGGKYSETIRGQ